MSQNSTTAPTVSREFDWGETLNRIITTGGDILGRRLDTKAQIEAIRASANASPYSAYAQPVNPSGGSAFGLDNRTLMIGGAVAVGLLAVVLIARRR